MIRFSGNCNKQDRSVNRISGAELFFFRNPRVFIGGMDMGYYSFCISKRFIRVMNLTCDKIFPFC